MSKYHLIAGQILVKTENILTASIYVHSGKPNLTVTVNSSGEKYSNIAFFETEAEARQALSHLYADIRPWQANRQLYVQLMLTLASIAIATYALWLPLVFK